MLWPPAYNRQVGALKGAPPIFWRTLPESYAKGITATLREQGTIFNEMAYLFEAALTVKRQPARAVWVLPNGAKTTLRHQTD